MIKKRKTSILLLILILPLALTGCWDYKDINRRTITLSIGVGYDYTKRNVEFCGENANLISGSRQQNQATISGVYNLTSSGRDFEKTRTDFDVKIPFQEFPGAIRVVIFSKDYAQNGIASYLNRINNLSGYRKSVLIVISNIPARQLLNIKPKNDISVGFAIEDTIKYLSDQGKTIYATTQKLLSDITFSDIGYVVPVIGTENNTVKYLGLAVFKDSKLIGIIGLKDTNGILYMLAKKPVIETTIPSPKNDNNLLSIREKLKKRKIKTSYVDGKVNINIDLAFSAQIQYPYHLQMLSKEEIKMLEDELSKRIEKEVVSSVNKSQSEFNSDIFQFARYFRADNPKIYKKINWKEEYSNARVNVNAKVKIVNTNLVDMNVEK